MARITGGTCGSKIAKTFVLECGTDPMLVESCGRQCVANNTTNTSATSTSALFSVNISTLVMNTRITITMAACSIDGIHSCIAAQTCQSSTVHSSCLVKARPSRRHVQHAARLDEQLNSERPSGAADYLKMQSQPHLNKTGPNLMSTTVTGAQARRHPNWCDPAVRAVLKLEKQTTAPDAFTARR